MSRLYIVCFDVSDQHRLRAVSRTLEDFGTRVQHSVFECYLDEKNHRNLQEKIAALIDLEADHVRYYLICPKDQSGILLDGNSQPSSNNSYHLV
ncbi:MAG: hypothetical protein NMNS01_17500 [Nitrosomonas sp.]|nr:MAG: hypothetical protein NMNS01_17500 [Nitrosomonas sp.]